MISQSSLRMCCVLSSHSQRTGGGVGSNAAVLVDADEGSCLTAPPAKAQAVLRKGEAVRGCAIAACAAPKR